MVFKVEPFYYAINTIANKDSKIVLLSPSGKRFSQSMAKDFSQETSLVLLSPRYEGVDERVKSFVDEEISIGDYVLTGGDTAALVLIETVSRYIKGVVGNENSIINESFESNLLDYPQYTQPRVFKGMKVPEVLLSGNHKLIAEWRKIKALEKTRKKRPDLLGDE